MQLCFLQAKESLHGATHLHQLLELLVQLAPIIPVVDVDESMQLNCEGRWLIHAILAEVFKSKKTQFFINYALSLHPPPAEAGMEVERNETQ